MAVVKRKLPAAPASVTKTVAKKAPVAAFAFPQKMSEPSTDIGEYSMLLFGEKKIGKTSLAAEYPNALFLMTEPGAKALAVYQVAISSWEQLKDAAAALVTDTRFKTVVIDTIDLAFKLCERAVCARMGIDHPSDEDWGKGWGAVRDEFTAWTTVLSASGKGIIYVSHAVEREIKKRSGEKYDRFQPTMAGQARDVIEGIVDLWVYYTYEGQRRTLILRGDEHIMAGHRLQKNFRWNGKEVRTIYMDPTPRQGYQNLMAAFANQYDPDAAPVTKTKVKK